MTGESETLPCGCTMQCEVVNGENLFIYIPCALDCEYYLYVQKSAARQNKPIVTIDAS